MDEVTIKKPAKRLEKKVPETLQEQLLQVVDDSLTEVLGSDATQITYRLFEQKHNLKPKDIPNNLERFQYMLREVFGTGALLIEKKIMENIYTQMRGANKKISIKYYDEVQFNLSNYINDIKTVAAPKSRLAA
ncbi:MAG: hypothetical protein NWF03_06605 [Candidatus Bathyarchaeota archaeon]|nr:hypothetical protein [Candidatus Bathyarchaeota archaeon]